MKIAVCVPIRGNISIQFFTSFLNLIIENSRNHEMSLSFSDKIPLDAARNELIKKALEHKPDYIWWIDSDMVIAPRTLEKLLSDKKDIVSSLYLSRTPPHKPVARVLKDGKYHLLDSVAENKIIEVDALGLGCMLVKMEIIEKLSGKYPNVFEFKHTDNSSEYLSEDFVFCEKAKKEGFKIFMDTGIVSGHIGELVIG